MANTRSLSLVLLFVFLDDRAGNNPDEAARLLAGDDDHLVALGVC